MKAPDRFREDLPRLAAQNFDDAESHLCCVRAYARSVALHPAGAGIYRSGGGIVED